MTDIIMTGRRELILPRPNSPQQSVIMDAFHDPNMLEMFVSCGTKFGKTFSASGGYSSRMSLRRGAIGRWIAPIYSQTKIGFRYCKKILPPEPDTHTNMGELSILFTGLDSKMEFRSGVNPEDLEGEGTYVNVLDEAAKLHQQVYDSTKTTTTVTRGLIAAFSTPRGKNWFYTKCMDAKERMEWAIKNGKPLTHIFITAPSSVNPLVTKEAIEEARRSMPDRLFRQYFEAEFIDDGSVFVGFRDCVLGPEIITDGKYQYWLDVDAKNSTVVIGADWGRTNDRTVFWAIDLESRTCVGFQRFYKTPYTEAIRKLVVFSRRFRETVTVLHDKTGLGTVIDDYLAETELAYEGINFTNASKADMVAKLITGFEGRDHFIPNWREAIDELDSYEVITTPTGNMTYGGMEGKHDDIVSAMMLAYLGLIRYGDRTYEVKFTDQPSDKARQKPAASAKVEEDVPRMSHLERFYEDLQSDAEDD